MVAAADRGRRLALLRGLLCIDGIAFGESSKRKVLSPEVGRVCLRNRRCRLKRYDKVKTGHLGESLRRHPPNVRCTTRLYVAFPGASSTATVVVAGAESLPPRPPQASRGRRHVLFAAGAA
jgi:hypothetical protein